MDQIEIQTMT